MTLHLIADRGASALTLTPGRTFVAGRDESCDLPVPDSTVSRQHAELTCEGATLRVRDLGSRNGTFVDGHRVEEALALAGARISFGQVAFWLREIGPGGTARQGSPEATILRQVRVLPQAGLAERLSILPAGVSLTSLGGESLAERQARQLALLLDIGRELSQPAEVDRLLDKIVDLIFQVMNVDRVALQTTGAGDELVPRIWRSRGETVDGGWRVPRSITGKVVSERVAVLSGNTSVDERFTGASVLAQKVQSALCAPLIGKQGPVLGIVYLDNLRATHSFGEEDLEFLTAFSGMAALAIENSQLVERARREAVVLSNFQRYFAPDLARQIAAQEGAVELGGSKRPVVVLFSDIRGFTPLSETMGPDEIASLLTEYFSAMVEIVFAHDGTLDKFIGDAVMALWGAPVAHQDDAARATGAAIAMQEKLAELNREWRRQGRPELAIGIGIHGGEVFAGNIGSHRRLEYTVLGDAVNTASRLCSAAGPGEILISESLHAALGAPPRVSLLPPLPLKGKAHPQAVVRVEWEPVATDGSEGSEAGERV